MEPTYRIAQLRPLHQRFFRALKMAVSLWVDWECKNFAKAWGNAWSVWGTWRVGPLSGAEESKHA